MSERFGGEKFGGGFAEYNSGDDDPSNGGEAGDTLSSDESDNVVDFYEWRRSHGYSVPNEVAPDDSVSESAEPTTKPETTATTTAQNKDKLLIGQVKVEKPLLTFERLLKAGKFLLERGLNALEAQGILPPELSKVFTFVAGEVIGSEPVKQFAQKVDTYTFDDYAIEREEKKIAREQERMAREAGRPTPNQA